MKQRRSREFLIQNVLVFLITLCLLSPGVFGASNSQNTTVFLKQKIVSKLSSEIEISPGSDYYIRFDSQSQTLNKQTIEPTTNGLSDSVLSAIVKSPRWIQRRLTDQFHNLNNPQSYADVLLNASKQTADEIAFSIACCPTGRVPSAALLKENAESLYEHDHWISYADIVEYDDRSGNYYSTIKYLILENGTEKYIEFPPDIYYWYVVHPKITTEDTDAEYGPIWRNYLFEHNDLGYPLLKEKLSTIRYLWDCTSYSQPGYRLWTECITQHPTAIEAISYWIGKTVPYPAIGDRPGKSCIVAHEHNGWCGELQKIAIAAQRAALIPTVAASNVGEDHVWREFYERGWHENDNWWSDTGGAVDQPEIYAYGWRKNMSAIYQWRGDGTILQDTTYYIHPEDRITVSFEVKDFYLQPIDGARVIVLVKGPKDITYYTNLIWENLQKIWDTLPEIIKGRLLTFLFERLKERFNQIPESITGFTITTWDYTNSDGRCSFELGKNLEYIFFIQEGNLKKPWQLTRYNTIRSLKTHTDKEFKILFSDNLKKPLRRTSQELPSGECLFNLTYFSTAYQLQQHFINDGIGRHETMGSIECFFVDQENFERYNNGELFTCYHLINGVSNMFSVSAPNHDWYLIFRNYNRHTNVVVDFSVDVSVQTNAECIKIVNPESSLFEIPIYNAGDIILLSGVTTADKITLSVDENPSNSEITIENGLWFSIWNTTNYAPGLHHITVTTLGHSSDEQFIFLLDAFPPSLSIETPIENDLIEDGTLEIYGHSADNYAVDHVEITLQNETRQAEGTNTWKLSWDIAALPLGDHILTIKAVDTQGFNSILTRYFVINESNHNWGPQILTVSYEPSNPSNTSNIIFYANITTSGPYAINNVILYYYTNETDTKSIEMYQYGQFPVQSRHQEDPLKNQSNAPVFGVELGQFLTGQTISYWIIAVDNAQNKKQSEIDSFTIL